MIKNNFKKRIYTSFFLFSLFFLIFINDFVLILSLLLIGIFSVLEFANLIKKITKLRINALIYNFFFFCFILSFSSLFYVLSKWHQTEFLLMIILLGCIASDIGGFIFGKLFKGPKLSKISPNKTISGALGSLIITIITVSGIIFFYTNFFSINIIVTAAITSLACQAGDLFFSFLKRKAKIKDTGSVLPGHGGLLDRFDGVFLGVPVGLICFIILF